MTVLPNSPTAKESGTASNSIDLKRIGYRVIQYWYIVVLSLLTTLSFAFYTNRYSQRTYSISSSIIIREKDDISGAELLYSNALIDQKRNYLNEPYIL
ncbi:MAG: capsular biosynthesis protein, partial [Cyclobacteriaceae bacterium]|nr:capsular biosynthesis protein [Cyclobacteriaceae bacterium]